MDTYVLYVDESGNAEPIAMPIQNGATPIFTLTGVSLNLNDWRDYDRKFHNLKAKFFPDELTRKGRKEDIEIKGHEIFSPRNAASTRRHSFFETLLRMLLRREAKVFAVTFVKNDQAPAPARSLYTHGFQILMERFHDFLLNSGSSPKQGIMICDSRSGAFRGGNLDREVAKSHQTYVFGHPVGRTLLGLKEAPLFADSKLTVGIQIADIVSAGIYANHYHYYARNLPGAINYSHCQRFWSRLDSLQYKNLQRSPQLFGYRVINHR